MQEPIINKAGTKSGIGTDDELGDTETVIDVALGMANFPKSKLQKLQVCRSNGHYGSHCCVKHAHSISHTSSAITSKGLSSKAVIAPGLARVAQDIAADSERRRAFRRVG